MARYLGMNAFNEGDSIDDNPYLVGSIEWTEWLEGYQSRYMQEENHGN